MRKYYKIFLLLVFAFIALMPACGLLDRSEFQAENIITPDQKVVHIMFSKPSNVVGGNSGNLSINGTNCTTYSGNFKVISTDGHWVEIIPVTGRGCSGWANGQFMKLAS